jgi:hypothetical protein
LQWLRALFRACWNRFRLNYLPLRNRRGLHHRMWLKTARFDVN